MRIPDRLYDEIVRSMPIACVDVVVVDPAGRVLLLKRENPPARGAWWFPGGRVLHGEPRADAARRKLREECGLSAETVDEIGTYDVMLEHDTLGFIHHGVTTVFRAGVVGTGVRLDAQSATHDWRAPSAWLALDLHPFVSSVIARVEAR